MYCPLTNDKAKEECYSLCPFHTTEELGTESSCCSVKASDPSPVSLPCLEVLMNAVTSLSLLYSNTKPALVTESPAWLCFTLGSPCSQLTSLRSSLFSLLPDYPRQDYDFYFFSPGFYRLLCDLYIILRKRQKAEHKHITCPVLEGKANHQLWTWSLYVIMLSLEN